MVQCQMQNSTKHIQIKLYSNYLILKYTTIFVTITLLMHFGTCMLRWQLQQHLQLVLYLAPTIAFCYFTSKFSTPLELDFLFECYIIATAPLFYQHRSTCSLQTHLPLGYQKPIVWGFEVWVWRKNFSNQILGMGLE